MPADQNFDVNQWFVRFGIVLICASLGVMLLIFGRKKVRILAVIQILLSITVPMLVGCYIYNRKIDGMDVCSDIEQIAYEVRMIQYGSIAPLILMGLYVVLVSSTTLTIQQLISLKRAF